MTGLPSLADQAALYVRLGVPAVMGLADDEFAALAAALDDPGDGSVLLALHPQRAPASRLAPLMRLPDHEAPSAKAGFIVVDLADIDEFAPIETITVPDAPLYLLHAPDRGDDLRNRSPDEALPELTARGRTPLLATEAICWALITPGVVEANHCYMAIGSRLRKANGRLDSRTPAIWISGGTGRDGAERRGAPKLGWCWAGNRHTWLGFASAASRG